jgi:hypothetical protein
MENLKVLAIVIAFAPLFAVQAQPVIFLALLVGAAALSWSICRKKSQSTKWFLGILLFLGVLWAGSILIIFGGFGPH